MRKKHVTLLLAALLTVGLVGGILAGCGSQASPAGTDTAAEVSRNTEGGVITLKVNPEIAVSYNKDGAVTKVEGKNDDGESNRGRLCRLFRQGPAGKWSAAWWQRSMRPAIS